MKKHEAMLIEALARGVLAGVAGHIEHSPRSTDSARRGARIVRAALLQPLYVGEPSPATTQAVDDDVVDVEFEVVE